MEKKRHENQLDEAFKIEDNWDVHLKNLKVQFPKVDFEDLNFSTGDEIELLEKLEKKLGKTKMEIINIIRMGVV